MKRAALLVALSLLVASCASMQGAGQPLITRAVQAVGGADTLAGVQTYYEKGVVKMWEPEQSHVAGGEMRFANESTFETTLDLQAGTARTDWGRKFAYPAPRQ